MNQVGSRKRGRPKKSFEELSSITKRQNAKKMRTQYTRSELAFAVEKSFKSDGFLDASKVVKNLHKTPELGTAYLQSYEIQKHIKKYTSNEALALYLDMGLTKRRYIRMYNGSKIGTKNLIYPPYHHVSAAKVQCYPIQHSITETGFSIDLQAQLDLTVTRLILTLPAALLATPNLKLCLVTKWGCDGASGQSQYKLKFHDANSDDSNIFMTSLVPIELHDINQPAKKIWKNMKPSSVTLCRPLRLSFVKESDEHTLQVKSEINREISNLRSTVIEVEGGAIEITHKLVCSMLDGKICNVFSETKSSQTCFICNATPKQMNKLDSVYDRPKQIEYYEFGLSTLHAWIRLMECVLHVSYNMEFKKWAVRSPEHKQLRSERKKEIQEKFKAQTGLRVDFVKQGTGTTNDGNTARSFFRNYTLSAEITGFDVILLKRFFVILQTISSGMKIDVLKFACYAKETAVMFVQLYGWYYMPVTVHKILVHGSEIIDYAIVPIGQLSEEVQETRHKEVRRYREFNTRKMSRSLVNEDLLHSLLISSDPIISSLRNTMPSKKFELLPEATYLLLDSHISDEE